MLRLVDYRFCLLLLCLNLLSLVAISGVSGGEGEPALSHYVLAQAQWFVIGWIGFFLAAWTDYRRLRGWAWVLYVLLLVALIGIFFTPAVHSVHRWYRLGGFDIQPSEIAKICVSLALAVCIDYYKEEMRRLGPTLIAMVIGLAPALLIVRQPDLGTAIILVLMVVATLYAASAHRVIVGFLTGGLLTGAAVMGLIFTGVIPHTALKEPALKVLKEYQYERLMPGGYHQKASQVAISLGGISGKGWRQADYTAQKWLPAAHTDSAFATYSEQFGLVGILALCLMLALLIYACGVVAAGARDDFGKILTVAITAGLGGHILVNMGMMSGLLPITGVPLTMITYGGSSVVTTMLSLGIIQSIQIKRYR